jgi:hypothetical protein
MPVCGFAIVCWTGGPKVGMETTKENVNLHVVFKSTCALEAKRWD